MFQRVIRGAIIGAFGALGAMALHLDVNVVALILVVAIFVSVVDVLAGEAFAVIVAFGVGALVWAWTPLGSYATEKFGPYIKAQMNSEPSKDGTANKEQPK